MRCARRPGCAWAAWSLAALLCIGLISHTEVAWAQAAPRAADGGAPQPRQSADAGATPSRPGADGGPSAASKPPTATVVPPRLLEPVELVLPADVTPPDTGVDVTLSIDTAGDVSAVELKTPLGEAADAAVDAAARKLRFEPARRDGQPVAVRVGFRFFAAPPSAASPGTPGAAPPSAAPASSGAAGRPGSSPATAAAAGTASPGAAARPGSPPANADVPPAAASTGAQSPSADLPPSAAAGSRAAPRLSGAAPQPPSAGLPPSAAPGSRAAPRLSGAAPPSPADVTPPSAATAASRHSSLTTAASADPDADSYGARAEVARPQPGAASRIKLRGAELRLIPGTFGEPLRVVATLPGVARSPFGLGFFVVRGASFQNTGFFVDDYPVPLLYHLGAGPAIIASSLVDELDFYAGGYPVALGRYTAGVISLHTAPPPTDRFQLEFEVDALRASVLAVMPLPDRRGSIAVAFRRSYLELILPLITDSVRLSYSDYQLRFDYRITNDLRMSVFFFGSRDALEANQAQDATTGGEASNTGLHYAFDQLITSLRWTPSPKFRVRWSATVGPSHIDFANDTAGRDSVGTNTAALRLGERLEAQILPHPRLETRVGVDLDAFITKLRGAAPSFAELPAIPAPGPPTTSIALAENLLQLGVAPYLEQVLRPGPFEITLGGRAEYMRYGDIATWLPEPRAVARYHIIESLWLKVGSGLFSQAPLPFQVLREGGNPSLRPNRALQNSFGAEIKLPASFEIDTTLFYNAMWQLTRGDSRPTTTANGDVRSALYADDGRGQAYGFELLLRRRVSKGLFGWLSYTLSRSERFLQGGRHVVFAFDQTHVLNLALSYAHGGWRYGARFTLATGRPVGDLLDPTGKNAIFDADGGNFDPSSGGRRVRLPTYHELDVRIDRDFSWGPFTGSVFLDIINVYNAQNSEAYQYQYDFSTRGRLPGIPFLPTIGIRGVLR